MDQGDKGLTDAKFLSESDLRAPSTIGANVLNLFICQFSEPRAWALVRLTGRRRIASRLTRMQGVFSWCYPLKISEAIISSIKVLVIHLKIRVWANERIEYETMNAPRLQFSIMIERDGAVALAAMNRSQHPSRAASAYSPKITDLVNPEVANHRSPSLHDLHATQLYRRIKEAV